MGRVRLNGEGEGYRVLGIGYRVWGGRRFLVPQYEEPAGSSYWGTRNRRPPHTRYPIPNTLYPSPSPFSLTRPIQLVLELSCKGSIRIRRQDPF